VAAKKRSLDDSGSADVDRFFRTLDHPRKAELEAVRRIILGARSGIREGIKWNAPSFRVGEWFATANIRKDVVFVVLHLGAKVRHGAPETMAIDDPAGLLTWRAKDRATVTFATMKDVTAARAAFGRIVRQWIAYLE